MVKLPVAVGLLAVGAATGLCAVALHELWWGLGLAAAATVAALAALPPGWWCRLAFAIGFALMVAYLVPQRPEGDYAIGTDTQGYVVIGLAFLVLLVGLATTRGPRRVRPVADDPAP